MILLTDDLRTYLDNLFINKLGRKVKGIEVIQHDIDLSAVVPIKVNIFYFGKIIPQWQGSAAGADFSASVFYRYTDPAGVVTNLRQGIWVDRTAGDFAINAVDYQNYYLFNSVNTISNTNSVCSWVLIGFKITLQ